MSLQRPSLIATLLLAASAGITGCSNMVTTASEVAQTQPGNIGGIVHGGRQPVAGATVTLWAAGNAGYGSASTMLATTTSLGDGTFNFSTGSGHTYACPSSNSPTASQSVYITALGGQPTTGITNSAAAFMTVVGDCVSQQTLNPSFNVDEVSTAVSITALQQFFTPSSTGQLGSIGTSATNPTGLANAMNSVRNVVNLANGSANASTTVSGPVNNYTTNPVITITPETSKINTMADILAACINSTGPASTACSTLFSSVNPTPAQDTLQAAFYMASNPTSTTSTTTTVTCGTSPNAVTTTSNICSLFNLATPQSPFAPTLTVAPTDWTIGVTYSSSSSKTVAGTPVYFLDRPQYVDIDSAGDVWIVNDSTTSATVAGNSATELSAAGVPLAQVLSGVGVLAAPHTLVVDPSNNLFVGSYGAGGTGLQVSEFNNTTLTTSSFVLHTAGPQAMVSDGAGNVYVATAGTADGAGDLEVIPSGLASGGTATQLLTTGVSVGANSSMAIDSYDDIWLSNAASTSTMQFICNVRPCTATTTTAGGQYGSESIVIDHSNNIWIGNVPNSSNAASLSEIAATQTSTTVGAANSPFFGGGLTNPTRSIFGGLGNQWVTNYASGAGTVSEFTSGGIPITPSVGFAHNYSGAYGIAIDGSGNVWIGNYGAAAPSGFITEILGAAGPVITPYSANLPANAGGANTIGNRP